MSKAMIEIPILYSQSSHDDSILDQIISLYRLK